MPRRKPYEPRQEKAYFLGSPFELFGFKREGRRTALLAVRPEGDRRYRLVGGKIRRPRDYERLWFSEMPSFGFKAPRRK